MLPQGGGCCFARDVQGSVGCQHLEKPPHRAHILSMGYILDVNAVIQLPHREAAAVTLVARATSYEGPDDKRPDSEEIARVRGPLERATQQILQALRKRFPSRTSWNWRMDRFALHAEPWRDPDDGWIVNVQITTARTVSTDKVWKVLNADGRQQTVPDTLAVMTFKPGQDKELAIALRPARLIRSFAQGRWRDVEASYVLRMHKGWGKTSVSRVVLHGPTAYWVFGNQKRPSDAEILAAVRGDILPR